MSDARSGLQEWLERVRANEEFIYVRERGRTVALSDLSPARWAHHVAWWLSKGTIPVIYQGP